MMSCLATMHGHMTLYINNNLSDTKTFASHTKFITVCMSGYIAFLEDPKTNRVLRGSQPLPATCS